MESGDRVYTYVWSGGDRQDMQPLTVIRVNRKTVTVRTDQGEQHRIHPDDIFGPYRDESGDLVARIKRDVREDLELHSR
jgi:hypothetical protein